MVWILTEPLNINSLNALLRVSILDGLLAAPLLAVIMIVSNNRKIMGERVNSRLVNILGWTTTLIILVAMRSTGPMGHEAHLGILNWFELTSEESSFLPRRGDDGTRLADDRHNYDRQ
jgi:hypothetical protein